MKKIRCVIVEDEAIARQILDKYLAELDDFELLASFDSPVLAQTYLRKNPVDLLFLDIEMPGLNGLSLLRSLPAPPKVIITTAYREYALEGYDLNAVDYLLKPISLDRFMKAVNKALEQSEMSQRDAPGLAVPATAPQNDGLDFFFVKADKKLVKVNFDDIIYIEGLKDYVIIRLTTGRVITLQTMKSLEDRLPKGRFKRIHRSYIVAMDKIMAIEGNMIEVMEKDKPKLLPIGKNYRDELLDLIEKNRL